MFGNTEQGKEEKGYFGVVVSSHVLNKLHKPQHTLLYSSALTLVKTAQYNGGKKEGKEEGGKR
jgi:hypothetical protein